MGEYDILNSTGTLMHDECSRIFLQTALGWRWVLVDEYMLRAKPEIFSRTMVIRIARAIECVTLQVNHLARQLHDPKH